MDGAFGNPHDVLIPGSSQGWAEDAFDGLTGAAVTATHSALVLPQVRAQDPVTAHVLALATDANVHRVWAAGCPVHHGRRPLSVEVEAFGQARERAGLHAPPSVRLPRVELSTEGDAVKFGALHLSEVLGARGTVFGVAGPVSPSLPQTVLAPDGRPGAVAVAAGRGHAAAARPAAVAPRGPRAPGPVHAFRPRAEGDTNPLVAPPLVDGVRLAQRALGGRDAVGDAPVALAQAPELTADLLRAQAPLRLAPPPPGSPPGLGGPRRPAHREPRAGHQRLPGSQRVPFWRHGLGRPLCQSSVKNTYVCHELSGLILPALLQECQSSGRHVPWLVVTLLPRGRLAPVCVCVCVSVVL